MGPLDQLELKDQQYSIEIEIGNPKESFRKINFEMYCGTVLKNRYNCFIVDIILNVVCCLDALRYCDELTGKGEIHFCSIGILM